MRIVCEQCQTTYIVPDDKIVKNVLRLTCQKCGHVITTRVDGAARGEKAPSPTLGKWQRSGTGVAGRMQNESPSWYYSINGESIGPFTEAELTSRLLSDKLASQLDVCYVWRKSFSQWQPVLEVEPFASALLMPPPPPAPPKVEKKSDSSLPPLFSGIGGVSKSDSGLGKAASGLGKSSPDLPGLKQRLQSSGGLMSDRQRDSLAKLAGVKKDAEITSEEPAHPEMSILNEMAPSSDDGGEDSTDKTRVRGPMPFLSFQSLDVISPTIKAEAKEGEKAPEMARPFPSLSGIPAISPKENKPVDDSANPRSGISTIFSNIRKEETGVKPAPSEDKQLKPSGIPRFAGLRNMASGTKLPSLQSAGIQSAPQPNKPVLNAVAELSKKNETPDAASAKNEAEQAKSAVSSVVPAMSDEKPAETADLTDSAAQAAPETTTSGESNSLSVELDAIDISQEPSLEINEISKGPSPADSIPPVQLADIDLMSDASDAPFKQFGGPAGASDKAQNEPSAASSVQPAAEIPARSGDQPVTPAENSSAGTAADAEKQGAQVEALDFDLDMETGSLEVDMDMDDDEEQKLVSSAKMLSMVRGAAASADAGEADSDGDTQSEVLEDIDVSEPTRITDREAIPGLFAAESLDLEANDAPENSSLAKAHSRAKLEDIEAKYADLFAEVDAVEQNLADESSVSEASQMIQLAHLEKLQKKETRKSGLIIAAIVIVIVLCVAGGLLTKMAIDSGDAVEAVNTAQTFNQTGGRAISSDELDEFVPNDEFEIIEDTSVKEPTPARRPKVKPAAGESEETTSNNERVMDALYGAEPEKPAEETAAPAAVKKQDGRANVVLQKAEDFANTDAVQGSKYAGGAATSRDAFKIGLKMVSVTVGECFRREAKTGNLNVEKVRIKLTVQPEGTVSDFKVIEEVPDSFNKCLEAKRDRWKFAPFTGSPVTMVQSFVRG